MTAKATLRRFETFALDMKGVLVVHLFSCPTRTHGDLHKSALKE